jgi:hypothetical protein
MTVLGFVQPNGVFFWTHRPHSDACEKNERDRKLSLSDPATPREFSCIEGCRHGEPWPTMRMTRTRNQRAAI